MLVNSNWEAAMMETEYMQGFVERRSRALVTRERLALSRGLALEVMRSKLNEVSAAEESGLLQADEPTLKTLIVELGLATDTDQARAAIARALLGSGH